jgi:hypothetical protein
MDAPVASIGSAMMSTAIIEMKDYSGNPLQFRNRHLCDDDGKQQQMRRRFGRNNSSCHDAWASLREEWCRRQALWLEPSISATPKRRSHFLSSQNEMIFEISYASTLAYALEISPKTHSDHVGYFHREFLG